MVSGNLFDNETRQTFHCMSGIGGIGILLYIIFMWFLFGVSPERFLFFLIALISTGVAGYYFWSGYRNYQLIFSTYEITDKVSLHQPNGKTYAFSLLIPYEVREISISLYQGKGQKQYRFYVLTDKSDCDVRRLGTSGIYSIQKLLESGYLPLPVDMRVLAVLLPNSREN